MKQLTETQKPGGKPALEKYVSKHFGEKYASKSEFKSSPWPGKG